MNIGYVCLCLSLPNVSVNRGMIKKTFTQRGKDYCDILASQNINDLYSVLRWNANNNISLYRLSSEMFPWMSHYEIEDLPSWHNIRDALLQIGNYIKTHNMRVGFHPGPFNVLASETENTVKNTIHELNQHAKILDYMGLPANHYYGINIHVNTTRKTKKEAINRFVKNFNLLEISTQKRITVEIDDKPSQYSVIDLQEIFNNTGCPVVYDNLHFKTSNHPGIDLDKAIDMCVSTWKCRPLIHWSSSKRDYEDKNAKVTAHADYIYDKIPIYLSNIADIELEAKKKDLALLDYREKFASRV